MFKLFSHDIKNKFQIYQFQVSIFPTQSPNKSHQAILDRILIEALVSIISHHYFTAQQSDLISMISIKIYRIAKLFFPSA